MKPWTSAASAGVGVAPGCRSPRPARSDDQVRRWRHPEGTPRWAPIQSSVRRRSVALVLADADDGGEPARQAASASHATSALLSP